MTIRSTADSLDEVAVSLKATAQSFALTVRRLTDPKGENEAQAQATAAVQFLMSRAAAGPGETALQAFERRHPRSLQQAWVQRTMTAPHRRAAVPAATTTDPAYAGDLLGEPALYSAYLAVLRPQMILGKLATTAVPFRKKLPIGLVGARAAWVAEGAAIPVTRLAYGTTSLDRRKVACLVVSTEEIVRGLGAEYEALLRSDLDAALIQTADAAFVDPTNAGGPDRPASIFNGLPPIVSPGTGVDDDLSALLGALAAANIDPASAAFILSTNTAIALAGLRDPSGARAYPGLGPNGGTLGGLPAITSTAVPIDFLGLVAASYVFVATEGAEFTTTDKGALDIDDAPGGALDPPAGMGANRVALYQSNGVAIVGKQFANWALARPAAAVWIDGFAPSAP